MMIVHIRYWLSWLSKANRIANGLTRWPLILMLDNRESTRVCIVNSLKNELRAGLEKQDSDISGKTALY